MSPQHLSLTERSTLCPRPPSWPQAKEHQVREIPQEETVTLEVEVPVPGKERGEEAAALGPSYPVLAEAPGLVWGNFVD